MNQKARGSLYLLGSIYIALMDYKIWTSISDASGYVHILMLVFGVLFIPLVIFLAFLAFNIMKKAGVKKSLLLNSKDADAKNPQ